MRILSECKLAIDDLYERIKDQNRKRVINAGKADIDNGDESKSASDLKSWLDKLHALQFRVLDLQDITKK